MRKNKKQYIALLLLGLSILTSCKPPLWFIDTGNNSQYSDRQQLVFTHLWQRGSTYYTNVNDLIKKFNESDVAKKLNVFVKGDGINFWDYWDKVNLSISGGSAPDIFIHAVSSTPTRLKYNLNLTEMEEKDVADGEETLHANDMFYQSQINDIAKYSDGDMYAWPFSATVRVIYYNKDMFEKAGITTIPKTWAEMEEISKKLTEFNTPNDPTSGYKTIGYDPLTSEGQYIHQWGWLADHKYWTEDDKGHPVPHFNDADYIENMNKIYSSYVRQNKTYRKYLEDFMAQFSLTSQNPFASGKVGMMVSNEGLYTTLKEADAKFNYGVFEMPTMDSSIQTSNWSSSYSIELYDNKHRTGLTDEVAEQRNKGTWEFLKFLYGEEAQGLIAQTGFMLSNRTYYDKYVYTDPILTDLTKAIEHTREAEYYAACPNWTSDIQTYVNSIAADKMTVKEAMDSAQTLLESKIEQYYTVNKGE